MKVTDMKRITNMGNLIEALEFTPTEVVFVRVDGTRGIRRCSHKKWFSWRLPRD